MSENYLMLNGKRVDLTEEQIEQLGLNKNQGIFDRQEKGCNYYYIQISGVVDETKEDFHELDNKLYNTANYCTNRELMQQRALHETLSRLLWRFSMQNDGDKIDWNIWCQKKFFITYNYRTKEFSTDFFINGAHGSSTFKSPTEYFYSAAVAQRAIAEIVLPFMKKHPEFIW